MMAVILSRSFRRSPKSSDRVQASMREEMYKAHVALAVQSLEPRVGCATGADDEIPDDLAAADSVRLVATRVERAFCQCTAGRGGGCHHVAMLLQLVRLLRMTDRELSDHDKESVTGRSCQWILDHCRGGRMAELNIWWRLPIGQITHGLRPLRNPKGRRLAFDTSTPCGTRGVVQIDREESYCPFSCEARHARWREHFYEGRTISAASMVGVFLTSEWSTQVKRSLTIFSIITCHWRRTACRLS